MTSHSTTNRIRRLYEDRIGYDPQADDPEGFDPRESLQILREHRDLVRAADAQRGREGDALLPVLRAAEKALQAQFEFHMDDEHAEHPEIANLRKTLDMVRGALALFPAREA